MPCKIFSEKTKALYMSINDLKPSLFLILSFGCITASLYAQQKTGTSSGDIGWPRQIINSGSKLVYYQPQVDEWKDYKVLDAQIAFSLTPKDETEVHGVASLSCETVANKETHTALLKKINVVSVRFPSLDKSKAEKMEVLFRSMFPQSGETISIERVMADLQSKKTKIKTVEVKNDPPVIFYSTTPAILLNVQGDPVLAPVSKTDLQFLVNTNWDVFYDKSRKEYYLLAESTWLKATALKGQWIITNTLPKDMSKLPSGENFDDVKKMVPPNNKAGQVTQVFFSDKPAELIALKGTPVYTNITGTNLLYVSNTDNDIILDNSNTKFYILLSGRWFSSGDLNGPWIYAGNNLPEDFKKIPDNSPKAHVLASVPGTVEASDAVLMAQIPTTAIINKAQAEAKVKVAYDGDKAEFKDIDGTKLQYASNTQEKVIKSDNNYYLCFQAVWFIAPSPDGPWKTAATIPAEIYNIPPSSPVYNVTYVTQTEASETTVESNVCAGYFGAFVVTVGLAVCIAYGTGWYYPPYFYWGAGMLYPYYRPYPFTYGAGYVYNPWTGGFAGGRRVYGPYGAAGISAWYNPATGRYGRSASVQGWYGGRTAAQSYNPWTGGYAATRQGHNPYAQWGSSVATQGGRWVQTGHVTNATGTTAGYRTSGGNQGIIHTGTNGVVAKSTNGTYVGHDGNIYKKNASGNWSSYKNGSWQQSVGGNGGTRQELDRSSQARDRGQMQTQRFQNFRSTGGARFSGGGFRRR
jgi:hypothetical protein